MNTKTKIDLQQLSDSLSAFIWNFKHGDNISYNIDVLTALYQSKGTHTDPELFIKPITVQIVSIIEAALVDFIARIDEATTHLPGKISLDQLSSMKLDIQKEKKEFKERDFTGEHVYVYLRRKSYNLSELIKIFKKYKLFGDKSDPIYKHLFEFADMRNRVHIENYYRNLDDREPYVFTESSLELLESTLMELWTKLSTDYKRPWKK